MKKSTKLVIIGLCLAASVFLVGCNEANKLDPNQVAIVVNTARAVNAATAPLNPYSPFIEVVLLAVAGVAGAWGRVKTVQANTANTKLDTATTTLGAVVQAIERVADKEKVAIKEEVASNLAAAQIVDEGKILISASKAPSTPITK